MRLTKSIALLLCIVFISATACQALAADSPTSSPLAQYASELTQLTGLKYYKFDNTQRYLDYKTGHPNESWENVITYVNIGLDTYFYTNSVVISNPGATNVLVNKYRQLPANFVPTRLETINAQYCVGTQKLTHTARVAFEKMCADAKKLGYNLFATSSYRSYDKQLSVYNSFFDPNDPASTVAQELLAARPGYSEHQTGLAVDVIRSNAALMNTPVYKWYAKNAYKYGFIIRYPYAKEPILGYTNEPWHLRYLGVSLATAVYKSGLTYDEYYEREIDVSAKGAITPVVGITDVSAITVGDKTVQLATYDILGTTYYKLRDVAVLLSGSPMQFDITWNPAASKIDIICGSPYSGDTALTTFNAGRAALVTPQKQGLDAGGTSFEPPAYSCGGAGYYRLEDILTMLGLTATDNGQGGLIILQKPPEPSPETSDVPGTPPAPTVPAA